MTIYQWCAEAQQQVQIKVKYRGKRQATVVEVIDCNYNECLTRNRKGCLIGKELEGKF
jgi:hypothetical protein